MNVMTLKVRWMCFLAVTLLGVFGGVAEAATIPIVVDRVLPDMREQPVVTFGVPFPQNVLPTNQVASVRVVDDQGQVVAHQQMVTATWDPTGSKGVRWMLMDFQPQEGKQYFIKTTSDAPVEQVTLPDVAVQNGGSITIDNGPIKGSVDTLGANIFSQLQSMNSPLGMAGQAGDNQRFSAFYVEHETKGVFRSDLDKQATLVLEETGPMRATLKLTGWYTNEAGEQFCRYAIRLHFYRGRAAMKVEHTFIFTGLSKEDRIKSVGIKLLRSEPEVGKKLRLYAGDADLKVGALAKDSSGYIHMAQISSERDRFDFISITRDGLINKVAHKGGGWLYGGGLMGFNVAIRDAWQQYPWAMYYDAGLLDVQLWSPQGGLLDLTWDGYWHELTDRQKRYMAGTMQRKEKDLDKWMDRLRQANNATGAGKTHEVWIAFFGEAYGAYERTFPYMSDLGREVEYPVIAYADPQWTCAAQALDWQPHAAKGELNDPQMEAALDALLPMMLDARDANHWYGWWDWGGYHQFLHIGPQLPRSGVWADDAGEETWHRARPKSHYQWGRYPWVQFMRSGSRDWLRYAQTFTLYSADRAHSHHTGHGRKEGAEYHYDNAVIPWMGGYRFHPGGDQIASNLQSKDDYVYAYWLTGSRRALDVLTANGQLLIDNHNTSGSWTKYPPGFSRGNDIRNAGMQLERVMMLYQATWDPRYLAIAKRLAEAFYPLDDTTKVAQAEANPPEGVYHQAATWAYQGMWFYDQVTQDPQFRKAMLAFIERARDYNPSYSYSGNVRAFSYGYLLTGDEFYLDLGRASCDYYVAHGISPMNFVPGGKQGFAPIPGFLGIMQSAPQAWKDANLPMGERGRVISWRYAHWSKSPALAGTRAFFRKTQDQPWSFKLVASHGGTFTLFDPQGKPVASRTMDPVTLKWSTFELPADGQTGDYTLMCTAPSEMILKTTRSETQPEARILQSTLPSVISTLDNRQQKLLVCRSLFFKVAQTDEPASVFLGALDVNRLFQLAAVDTDWTVSNKGQMPQQDGYYRLHIPREQQERLVELKVVSQPWTYFHRNHATWPQLIRYHGIHPYVAANASDFFLPNPPEQYQMGQ